MISEVLSCLLGKDKNAVYGNLPNWYSVAETSICIERVVCNAGKITFFLF
jgi:hypothetical protein